METDETVPPYREGHVQQEETPVRHPQDAWYTPLTRVTPLSRALAVALFIVLPILGFVVGVEQAKGPDVCITGPNTKVQKDDTFQENIDALKKVLPENEEPQQTIHFLQALQKSMEELYPDDGALIVRSQHVADKRSVRVERVDMPQPGFVVISTGNNKGSSTLLPAGVSSDFVVTMQMDINHDGAEAYVYTDDDDGVYTSSDTYTMYNGKKRLSSLFMISVPLPDDLRPLSDYVLNGEKVGDCQLITRLQSGKYESFFGGGDPSQGTSLVQLSSNREAFMKEGDFGYGLQKSLHIRNGEGVIIFSLQCIGRDSLVAEKRYEQIIGEL